MTSRNADWLGTASLSAGMRGEPRDSSRAARRGVEARKLAVRAGFAAWAALAIYCLLSLLAGPAGLVAYSRLESRNGRMRSNLEELGKANGRLRVELESLRSDVDRAAREARSLGYLRPGERSLVLAGRSSRLAVLDAGKVLAYDPPPSWPDSALKEIAFGAFLAILAASLAPRGVPRGRSRGKR